MLVRTMEQLTGNVRTLWSSGIEKRACPGWIEASRKLGDLLRMEESF